jgi:hypothetical protein
MPHIDLTDELPSITGPATWAPEGRAAYDQMAERVVEHGDGASLLPS